MFLLVRNFIVSINRKICLDIAPRLSPFQDFHHKIGAKMFEFHGWSMPLVYSNINKEYFCTRNHCCLFDISHMSQIKISGKDRTNFVEQYIVGDLKNMSVNKTKLSLITNQEGGIDEDLIVINRDSCLYLVCNAANATKVKNIINQYADKPSNKHLDICIKHLSGYGFISIQGPATPFLLNQHILPSIVTTSTAHQTNFDGSNGSLNLVKSLGTSPTNFGFMDAIFCNSICGIPGDYIITRSGYTGEDGIEISIPPEQCMAIITALMDMNNNTAENNKKTDYVKHKINIQPAGFMTRDLLRLEAGLCLHGNDIDSSTNPVEAQLGWTIGQSRKNAQDFTGADIILPMLDKRSSIVQKRRIGFLRKQYGKGPIPRHGYGIYAIENDFENSGKKLSPTDPIGHVTSGNFSPMLNSNIAMGYLDKSIKVGATVTIIPPIKSTTKLRKKFDEIHEYVVVKLPFISHKYVK